MNNNDNNSLEMKEQATRSALDNATDEKQMLNDLNDLSDEEIIDCFIEGLMMEKGIELAEKHEDDVIFSDLKKRLLSEIDRSLLAELPDEKLEEFNKIAEDGGHIDAKDVSKAIEDAKLDVSEITLGTMAKFKELYLGENEEKNNSEKSGERKIEINDGVAESKEA